MPLAEVRQQPQEVCQSVQDLVQNAKDSLRQTHAVLVWSGYKKN